MVGTPLVFGLALLAAVLSAGGFATAALAGLSYLVDKRPRPSRRCDAAPVIIARVRAQALDSAIGRHAAPIPQKLPGGQGGRPARALPVGSPRCVRTGSDAPAPRMAA